MDNIRVGVIGVGRGKSMIKYCQNAQHARLVAVCDFWEDGLNKMKAEMENTDIAFYLSYDEFLNHPMDVVVLANYANEHAPFAIKAMKKGMHVISEVLPCQCLKEAVELIETVEETGKHYFYLENYCYMPAPAEMKRLYEENKIGEFRYAEGEYVHNCEPIWHSITQGNKDHWRNRMYSTFYCTHSIGPIVHITGERPVTVTGFETPYNDMQYRMGALGGGMGMIILQFSNGGIMKSLDMGLYKNSIWYSIYGAKGRMESAREDAEMGDVSQIYVNADPSEGAYDEAKLESYRPQREFDDLAKDYGHGGSDFYAMWHCIEALRGNPDADVIDVYEALDMFLPGLFAYFSILDGNKPQRIPDLRQKEVRDLYRNDTRCTDPKAAGDMLLPCCSTDIPQIPDSIYDAVRAKWLETQK